jgi:hypothetical protein
MRHRLDGRAARDVSDDEGKGYPDECSLLHGRLRQRRRCGESSLSSDFVATIECVFKGNGHSARDETC